jgi:glycerol-3-phosphate acyltransferase PlsY
MLTKLLFVLVAYLLGAIPFGYILVKYLFTSGEDIRDVGSGGTGATNVTRRAGKLAGLLTYLLDMAKGIAAVLLMKKFVEDDYYWIGAAAVAAIIGHIFPVFLGFRGGKGVAVAVGAFIILATVPVLVALGLWLVIVLLTRYISLGSIVAAASVPLLIILFGWLLTQNPRPDLWPLVITTAMGSGLIVAKHHENISRLLAGTESRFGSRVGTTTPEVKDGGKR